MRFRGSAIVVLATVVALWSTAGREPARAQVAAGSVNYPPQAVGLGMRVPLSGDWAQVLTITDKWLVLQNSSGQQFPVATNAVQLFLMRWPTAVERLSNRSLVEVTGLDLGSYRVQTDHLNVYEGAAAQLVSPALYRITGFGRVQTPMSYQYDFGVYGEPFPGVGPTIMHPGEGSVPPRMHAVGPVICQSPLRLGVPGNSVVTILPSAAGLTMTQVTPGSYSLVRPGDMAYFVPVAANVKSLGLGQLVVYKGVPFGP